MFPKLAEHPAQDPTTDDEKLREIAVAMGTESSEVENPRIPSGYVYFGQFVDHDITFDPTSQLQRRDDPEGLLNFRTPRFDLDSVYSSGPDVATFLYDNAEGSPEPGTRFLLERQFDMPRNSQGRALIGDPRNDENGFVSQLHVAFLKFHNRRMDDLAVHFPDPRERFNKVQTSVQWHYQWVVAHDFLRRIIGDETHAKLLQTQTVDSEAREFVSLRFYKHKVRPFMPVEFSVAAYRYGHSQVRDRYSINTRFERELFSVGAEDFRGFMALRPEWQASWPFFFEIDSQAPQMSRPIDTHLAQSLLQLQGSTGDDANLAFRNLRRGAALGLPSGQAVATAMGEDPLTDAELTPADPGNAPLWFYILKEAELRAAGAHLGPVGGRIVGEVLLGLLRADPQSYLRLNPAWVPELPTRSGEPRSFDMVDLLSYAVPDQVLRF